MQFNKINLYNKINTLSITNIIGEEIFFAKENLKRMISFLTI